MKITIEEEKINVEFSFDQALVNIIRELPGAKWNAKNKTWEFPKTLVVLSTIFKTLEERHYEYFLYGNKWGGKKEETLNYREYQFGTVPYQHQKEALTFALLQFDNSLRYNVSTGMALFMEMGTGKTKTIIDIAGIMHESKLVKSVLVIVPLSIIDTWIEQLRQHSGREYVVHSLIGGKSKREKALDAFDKYNGEELKWALINPEGLAMLKEQLKVKKFDMAVIDESTVIKNHTANRSKIAKLINSRFKIIASGNPIPKCHSEIFSQYEFVEPGVYGNNFYRFRDRYFELDHFKGIKDFKSSIAKEEYLEKFHSVSFVVKKEDCLDLPDKIYEKRYATMSQEQGEVYKRMHEDAIVYYNDVTCAAPVVLSKFLRLSQITGGALFGEGSEREKVVTLFSPNEKLKLLMETIEEIGGNKQIVIWTRFIFEIILVKNTLLEAGFPCVSFCGENSKDEKTDALRIFREQGVRFFIGTPASGGKGINDLVGCNNVIYYSNSYNTEDREQSEARTHRQGTKGDHVLYIDLLMKDTIDIVVLKVLRQNKSVSDAILSKTLLL